MTDIEVTYTVTTPMFCSGAHPKENEPELRLASFKGVLRYYEPFIRTALAGWAGWAVLLAIDTTSLDERRVRYLPLGSSPPSEAPVCRIGIPLSSSPRLLPVMNTTPRCPRTFRITLRPERLPFGKLGGVT